MREREDMLERRKEKNGIDIYENISEDEQMEGEEINSLKMGEKEKSEKHIRN